jgi:putative PIN family toxin of toxin-antitoxin system
MRVVLDTNVAVSRYLSPRGVPAQILANWRAAIFDLVVSEAILAEYQHTLQYERLRAIHHMNDENIAAIIGEFREFALLVEPLETPSVISADPADDKFLACAITGAADYIISGDGHLLNLKAYQGIRVLTPTVFLAVLTEQL